MSDFPPRHDDAEKDVVSPFPSLVESRIQRTPAPDEWENLDGIEGEAAAATPAKPAVATPAVPAPRRNGLLRRILRPKRKARNATAEPEPKPRLTPVQRRLALPAGSTNDAEDESAESHTVHTAAPSHEPDYGVTVEGTTAEAENQPEAVDSRGKEDGQQEEARVAEAGDMARAAELATSPNETGDHSHSPAAAQSPDPAAPQSADDPEDAVGEEDGADTATEGRSLTDESDQASVARAVAAQGEHGFGVSPEAASSQDGADEVVNTGAGREDVAESADTTTPATAAQNDAGFGEEEETPSSPAEASSYPDTISAGEPHDANSDTEKTVGAQIDPGQGPATSPQSSTGQVDDDRSPGSTVATDSRQLATVDTAEALGARAKPTSFRGPGLPTPLTSGRTVRRFTAPHVSASLKRRVKSGAWQPSTPPRPLMPDASQSQTRQPPRQFWPLVALLAMPAVVVLVVVLLLA